MGKDLTPSYERRLDTRLESEGAEFLVLGQLLIHRVPTYKTYTNMPGYDLVATHPEHNRSARIQVKSRWSTGAKDFPIQSFDCEFVVAAFLNRGSKDGSKPVIQPHFYVLPVDDVRTLPRTANWRKVSMRHVPDLEHYREAWHLISDFLARPASLKIGVASGDFEVPDETRNEAVAQLFKGDA